MTSRLRQIALAALVFAAVSAGDSRLPRVDAQSPSPGSQTSVEITDAPSSATTKQLLTFTSSMTLPQGVGLGGIVWTFGDGASAGGETVRHTYRSAGDFIAQVTLTDAAGTVSQASVEVRVTDDDVVLLAPGDSITFASPFVMRPPPPQGPPPPAFFGPLNLEVENQSEEPLTVSYDYDSSKEPSSIGQANVELALPDGYALLLLSSRAPGAPRGFSTTCTAVNGQANQASCLVGTSAMPGGTDRVTIMANPAGDVQRLTLPPATTATLIGPEPAAHNRRGVPSLAIGSGSDQIVEITWDGASLTVAAPDGYAVSQFNLRHLPPNAELTGMQPDPNCSEVAEQPSSVECSFSASPPVEFSFSTVLRAPSGTFESAYSDNEGPGTVTVANTGPDVAPGGAAIDVSLVQGDLMLTGSGVMRTGYQAGYFMLAFEMADASGDRYLFQAQVTADAGGFSGRGLWLSEADETVAGSWSVGTPPDRMVFYSAGSISTAIPSEIHGIQGSQAAPTFPLPSFHPGLPLPVFTGAELIGGGLRPFPAASLGVVDAPTLGKAGEVLNLLATTGAPCCGPGASQTWRWSFGDGAMSEPSSTQTVAHTWAAPGVYTVAAVFRDETGVSTFAMTQIRIAPASS